MNKAPSPFQLIRSLFIDTNPSFKLVLVGILMGVSLMVLSFVGMLLAMPLFSLSWSEVQTVMENGFQAENISFLKYLQTIQSIGFFLVPGLLANYMLFVREECIPFNYYPNKLITGSILVLATLLLSAPLINKLIEWNNLIQLPDFLSPIEDKLIRMETERGEYSSQLLNGTTIGSLFINLFIVAILPALGEEIFFRGVLQKLFAQWTKRPQLAILLSAILFSAIHFQFYGFFPRMLLGCYFGYLLYWTGNIWWPVLAHFMNNSIAVFIIYLENNDLVQIPGWLNYNENANWLIVLISFSCTALMIFAFRKAIVNKPV